MWQVVTTRRKNDTWAGVHHLREQALNQAKIGDSFYDQISAFQQSVSLVGLVLACTMLPTLLGAATLLEDDMKGLGRLQMPHLQGILPSPDPCTGPHHAPLSMLTRDRMRQQSPGQLASEHSLPQHTAAPPCSHDSSAGVEEAVILTEVSNTLHSQNNSLITALISQRGTQGLEGRDPSRLLRDRLSDSKLRTPEKSIGNQLTRADRSSKVP